MTSTKDWPIKSDETMSWHPCLSLLNKADRRDDQPLLLTFFYLWDPGT